MRADFCHNFRLKASNLFELHIIKWWCHYFFQVNRAEWKSLHNYVSSYIINIKALVLNSSRLQQYNKISSNTIQPWENYLVWSWRLGTYIFFLGALSDRSNRWYFNVGVYADRSANQCFKGFYFEKNWTQIHIIAASLFVLEWSKAMYTITVYDEK